MKLIFPFETLVLDDEIIAVPVGTAADYCKFVFKMNNSAAFILELLRNDISEEDICAKLSQRYHLPRIQAARDASQVINVLQKEGWIAV